MDKQLKAQQSHSLLMELKSLLKGWVLISNVMPVFTGFWLALYFTNTALSANWSTLILTLIGSTFVMGGALIFNNWYEVDLDEKMLRTKNRPTVTGAISLKIVLILSILFTVIGFVLMLFTTIEATIYAFIGWFIYVVLYTLWSKRRYSLNTVIGSLSGAVTPLIGWAAVAPSWHIVPISLFLILFIWQIPHTFAIAIKRSEEYRAAGVPMLPVVAGFAVTKRQIFIYILSLFPMPILLHSLGLLFVIGATLLNIGWLVLAFRGFKAQDDKQWAHSLFIYSLIYLTLIMLLAIGFSI